MHAHRACARVGNGENPQAVGEAVLGDAFDRNDLPGDFRRSAGKACEQQQQSDEACFHGSEHPVEEVQGKQTGNDRTEGDPKAPRNGDRDNAGQQALVSQCEA